ncbi:hypothetical protein ACVBEH_31700, partial [Roseateles sp. GG27B]
RLLEKLIVLNGDLGLASSVDDLQQRRLALVRQHHGRDLPTLARALIEPCNYEAFFSSAWLCCLSTQVPDAQLKNISQY